MTVTPTAFAVTIPPEVTVARVTSVDVQIIFWFVASTGVIDAVNCSHAPITILVDDLFRLTPETATGTVETVTVQVATKPPSEVEAIITAVPTAAAVIRPLEETVTFEASLDNQDIF